ncbi:MAG: hypothetical protein Q8Q89_04215 [bacterium]|nr:hypothetical protein [bacterium]
MAQLKIFIIFLLIVALILPYAPLYPNTASAETGDFLIGGISCVVGGVAAEWLLGYINKGIQKLKGILSAKLESWLALTNTVPVIDQEALTKERVFDLIARCGAREVLNVMTGRMIGAVRTSGRDGGPAFVRNWRNFKLTSQRRGENIFRSVLNSTELCPYFSGDIRTIFNADGQPNNPDLNRSRINNLDSFTRRARCTMPTGWSPDSYKTNFSGNGGWDALVRLSEPQNNYYGNLLMSLGEVSVQRMAEEDSDTSSVLAGLGFDSRRGKGAQENCLLTASNGRCIVYKDIITPGSVLQQTVSNVAQQELAWVTNVDELNELISTLTEVLLSRIINLAEPDDTEQEPYPRETYPGNNPEPDTEPIIDLSGGGGGGGVPPPPTHDQCVENCRAGAADGIDVDSCIELACTGL